MPLPVSHAVAAILQESKQPLVIDEIDLPKELTFGQVLVQVHFSGICGAQINEIDAVKGPDKFLPHLLGHEGSATVLAIGAGVKHVQVGDHVVMHWRPGAGLQADPPTYQWRGRPLNAGWVTTFNTHAVVSENRVTPIPQDFDLTLAPLLGCSVTTAFGVISSDARVKPGESVVIVGAGGVGLALVQAAAAVSAYPIVAIDIGEEKLRASEKLGASHVFINDGQDLAAKVREVCGGDPDVIIETTGIPHLIEWAYETSAKDGRTILVGVPPKDPKPAIHTLPLHFDKILTGSHGGDSRPAYDIPRLIRLIQASRLHLGEIPNHLWQLADVNLAVEELRAGRPGRIILDCQHNRASIF
jgi:S-(hydroxymethyl)glutathione dehydrogenase/alcohol dehydrogenase